MSTEENKAVVRRFVEEVQNRHDINALEKLFSPDYVDHSHISNLPPTLDGTKKFFSILFAAFPDIRVTIHDQVAEGDRVVTRKTFHGTHQEEFMGIPSTGKPIAVDVIDIFRVADGKILEHWAVADMLGLMQQLGVVSPPDQPGE
ncbi:MAG: ester cyclase [Desulfobacterales bacterium]|nr:MAG: ester cyclase [Desulfobacterales bacterium]